MAGLKKLPIGIQTFEDIIAHEYLYVDKTALIHQVITDGKVYFLSRPRRFGKSLLLSTMQAIFEGKRELFKGLAIDQLDYDWQHYPVILISMPGLTLDEKASDLREKIRSNLSDAIKTYNLEINHHEAIDIVLKDIVIQLAARGKKVVVLIDEYDKPILDCVGDADRVNAVRSELQIFYGILKSLDAHLKFLFLTGVSQFTKTSIFSGLNQLEDISLDKSTSALLGYTDQEIDVNFNDYFLAMSPDANEKNNLRNMLREWYNGYKFHQQGQPVYNPFSVLCMLKKQTFGNYWFATGTPTFLIKELARSKVSALSFGALTASSDQLSNLMIEDMDFKTLLFQTGYFTLDSFNQRTMMYQLKIPNKEIYHSLYDCLLQSYVLKLPGVYSSIKAIIGHLEQELEQGRIEGVIDYLKTVFASIPSAIHVKLEAYYQSVFYAVLIGTGFKVILEDATNIGQIDMVLTTETHIYVIEFKMDPSLKKTPSVALSQIIDRRYWEKYRLQKKEIVLVGIAFSSKKKNIVAWDHQTIQDT